MGSAADLDRGVWPSTPHSPVNQAWVCSTSLACEGIQSDSIALRSEISFRAPTGLRAYAVDVRDRRLETRETHPMTLFDRWRLVYPLRKKSSASSFLYRPASRERWLSIVTEIQANQARGEKTGGAMGENLASGGGITHQDTCVTGGSRSREVCRREKCSQVSRESCGAL